MSSLKKDKFHYSEFSTKTILKNHANIQNVLPQDPFLCKYEILCVWADPVIF